MMKQKVLQLFSIIVLFTFSFSCAFSYASRVSSVVQFLETFVGEFSNFVAVRVNLHELSKREKCYMRQVFSVIEHLVFFKRWIFLLILLFLFFL